MNPQRRLSVSAVVGAMGIVYGDIGTSPLYALESALDAAGGFAAEVVLGVLSLVFWSLTISVTLKYVTVIMRADNEGEGGILALFALAQRRLITGSTWAKVAVGLALAGTAFFFCDALIMPAISVLGAVEGLEVLNPGLKSGVVPVTIIVITVLFAYQRHGTASVARLFGPVMLLWFVVIGVIGVIPIVRSPQILLALNPLHGIDLLVHRAPVALAIIGAVFLAITGGEALYADMGQFGRRPVRIAWFALVGPALVINYFGQGALLLELGRPVAHPLYHLVSAAVLPWMVVLATDCAYVAGNLTKVPDGGWIPLTLGAALCLIFTTWRSGRLELRAALAKMAVPRSEIGKLVTGVHRVPGTGVFLASNSHLVPSALIRNIEHNGVVHQRVIILNVEISDTPRQDPVRRLRVEEVVPGVHFVTARFGFMETPDVAEALKACRARGLRVFTEDRSSFVGRRGVRARPLPGLRGLQRRLFARMQQYSTQAAEFFRMPFRDVVVLNTAVEI